jgi:hypothetical protein
VFSNFYQRLTTVPENLMMAQSNMPSTKNKPKRELWESPQTNWYKSQLYNAKCDFQKNCLQSSKKKLPQKFVQLMRNLTRVMVTHFNGGSNQLDLYYFSSSSCSSQRVGYHTCGHISNNPDLFLYVKTKFEEFILVKEISQRDNF